MKVGSVEVVVTEKYFRWTSGMAIDCDGSPRAYAPAGSGLPALDYLANAGNAKIGWFGLVTDTFTGKPFIQDEGDPAPGYYVSPTALADISRALRDPRRYVNAEEVPYLAVSPRLLHYKGPDGKWAGVRLGDVAWVTYGGLGCEAIVADVGPNDQLGEGSVFLAKALGIPPSPKNGGVESGVTYTIYRGTAFSAPWPRTVDSIYEQVRGLLAV